MGDPRVFFSCSARAAGTAERRVNLVFNYPVRPADVRGRLRVSRGDKSLDANIIITKHGQTLGLSFAQDVRPGAPITTEITPGLRPATGIQATITPLVT